MPTAEEDLVAATSMDGSALSAIDALPSCHAISRHPRAAGYRGSDFVPWHKGEAYGTAAIPADNCGISAWPTRHRGMPRLALTTPPLPGPAAIQRLQRCPLSS